jgi:cyclohexanecarboxylate-CoA ligase
MTSAPGAVVSYVLPNWAETVVLHHAMTALGMVTNPIVPIYRHAEIGFIAQQARAALIVIPHEFRGFDYVQMLAELRTEGAIPEACRIAVVRPLRPLPDGFIPFADLFRESSWGPEGVDRSRPADVTLLLYTSGTTAAAKGALHSHETLVCVQRAFERWFSLDANDVVSWLLLSPTSRGWSSECCYRQCCEPSWCCKTSGNRPPARSLLNMRNARRRRRRSCRAS